MVRGLTTTRGTIGLRTTEVKEPRHGQDSLGILKDEHECFNNWAHFKGTTATPTPTPTGNVGSLKGKGYNQPVFEQKDDFFLLDTGSSRVALNLLCC